MNMNHLPNDARIWFFMSNRRFTPEELNYLNLTLTNITVNWKAHGTPLKAGYSLLYDQLIVLAVDESHEPASGCSIDSVVHEMQAIEKHLGVHLFNRTDVPIIRDGQIELYNRQEFREALLDGRITEEMNMIDLTSNSLGAWRDGNSKLINQSWAARWMPKLQS